MDLVHFTSDDACAGLEFILSWPKMMVEGQSLDNGTSRMLTLLTLTVQNSWALPEGCFQTTSLVATVISCSDLSPGHRQMTLRC